MLIIRYGFFNTRFRNEKKNFNSLCNSNFVTLSFLICMVYVKLKFLYRFFWHLAYANNRAAFHTKPIQLVIGLTIVSQAQCSD